MSQAGAGDLPDMVYTGQVPSATCHVPRVSPPISRATSPPSSPSSAAPPSSPSSSSWSSSSAAGGDSDDDDDDDDNDDDNDDDDDDNDGVGAGGAAGTRTTSPTAPSSTTSSRTQSASAPVWRSTSRWGQVTCHMSRVHCHVSRVRTSSVTMTWQGCWGRASPPSSVRTASRWSCPPRASSSSLTHGKYLNIFHVSPQIYYSCFQTPGYGAPKHPSAACIVWPGDTGDRADRENRFNKYNHHFYHFPNKLSVEY